jgi:hypothetical protein
MPEALSLAAGQHLTTPTEWARQALLRSLQAEGIRICDGKAAVGERGKATEKPSLASGKRHLPHILGRAVGQPT